MKKKTLFVFLLAAGLSILRADAAADWSPVKRLTWTSGRSYDPAMAIDSSNTIHVVWNDSTPGNYEIYYKNGQ